MNAIKELPDDAVSYVLPISIAAIEENRLVEVIYEMKTVASPTDGGQTWTETVPENVNAP